MLTTVAARRAIRDLLALHKPTRGYYVNRPEAEVCAHCTSAGDPYTHPDGCNGWPCATVAALIAAGIDPDTYAKATPRPRLDPAMAELVEIWLAPNGIDGWLPLHATIVVTASTITFPEWQHADGTGIGWGSDLLVAKESLAPVCGFRTVPLVVPLSARARTLASGVGLVISEPDKPADTRPYRMASAAGGREVTYDDQRDRMRRVFRQIGWHGATGAFYSLDEHPQDFERGSFSPLWIIAHADHIPDPEEQP